MSRFFAGVLTALVAVVMTLGAVQDAEAKRLGGGKSFGSIRHWQPVEAI